MDRKYIDDHHIVARYLADQLTQVEREAFEAYYLDHPQLVQELEATARFKAGLMQLRESGELEALLQPKPWYGRARYAATAAALVALALGLAYIAARSPDEPPLLASTAQMLFPARGTPAVIASSHLLMRMRASSYDAEVDLPAAGEAIELRVLPEFEAQPPRYRLALLRQAPDDSLQTLAELDGLTPAEDGLVTLYVNGASLAAGRYQLSIAGGRQTSAAGERSTFAIAVRAPREAVE